MNGVEQAIRSLESGLSQFPDGSLRPVLIALLGFTFAWSGIAKARSPWTAALAVVHFGFVRRPSLRLAWAVALGEIGLAAMLLVAPSVSSSFALLAAGLAACTLVGFSFLIARALSSGRSFACACFGSGKERLSRATLARASALALLAVACTAAGSLGQPLTFAELGLTWCAAAGLLATGVLLVRAREVARLPKPACQSVGA